MNFISTSPVSSFKNQELVKSLSRSGSNDKRSSLLHLYELTRLKPRHPHPLSNATHPLLLVVLLTTLTLAWRPQKKNLSTLNHKVPMSYPICGLYFFHSCTRKLTHIPHQMARLHSTRLSPVKASCGNTRLFASFLYEPLHWHLLSIVLSDRVGVVEWASRVIGHGIVSLELAVVGRRWRRMRREYEPDPLI